MFCLALRRSTFEEIGELDERFGLGLFEDDDYSRRVRRNGGRTVCAEGVFVHHFGEGALGSLAACGEYGELFSSNRRRFEEKWGVEWRPHERRTNPAYELLRQQFPLTVGNIIPAGSRILVVTRGDGVLLELPGYEGWHFPREDDGTYAGHHPADDDEAIDHLEQLRREGADFLVIPSTSTWWLEHYRRFWKHLDERYDDVTAEPAVATVYDLRERDGQR
jgi:hypothetical protein